MHDMDAPAYHLVTKKMNFNFIIFWPKLPRFRLNQLISSGKHMNLVITRM